MIISARIVGPSVVRVVMPTDCRLTACEADAVAWVARPGERPAPLPLSLAAGDLLDLYLTSPTACHDRPVDVTVTLTLRPRPEADADLAARPGYVDLPATLPGRRPRARAKKKIEG